MLLKDISRKVFLTKNEFLVKDGITLPHGGSGGILVAIMPLAGGIVSIATRNKGKGGNVALIILFGIGALFGYMMAGSFPDLKIWATWCLINVILAIAALVKGKQSE